MIQPPGGREARAGGRSILVVTTVVPEEGRFSAELGRLIEDDGAVIRVVAPAAKVSRLDWLTNDEDAARADAREAAERVAGALGTKASVEIDYTSENTDAAQAVKDALRTFRADELIVVTRPGDESSWLEDETVKEVLGQSGIPGRHIELPEERS